MLICDQRTLAAIIILTGCTGDSGVGSEYKGRQLEGALEVTLSESTRARGSGFHYEVLLRNNSDEPICLVYAGAPGRVGIDLFDSDKNLRLEYRQIGEIGLAGPADLSLVRNTLSYEVIEPGQTLTAFGDVSEGQYGYFESEDRRTVRKYEHGDYLVARAVVSTGPCRLRDADYAARVRSLTDVASPFSVPFRF